VIKATAIDPSVVDDDGVYRHTGRARVFVSEAQAIKAIKRRDQAGRYHGGDRRRAVRHRHGRDLPAHLGAETYLVGKTVSLITDARFSGVSTGACFGHVAGGAGGRADWQAAR
jgi:dihydroxyacid dehydratase/phosphogluconate dehydratase